MMAFRIVGLVAALLGLGAVVWLLAVGSTHHYRADTDDEYYCNAVLQPVRTGDDYPQYYDEIDESSVDYEDDVRRDEHATLAEKCDRHRQIRTGYALLLLVPTLAAGYFGIRPNGSST